MSHRYSAYGIVFDSDIWFPQLQEIQSPAQVRIIFDEGLSIPTDLPDTSLHRYIDYEPDSQRAIYFYEEIGFIVIENGDTIRLKPNPKLDRSILGQILFSFPLRMLLQQRGFILLHASAVAIRGASVAFCGQSGMGKSTLAAHCQRQGYPLITDDTLAANIDPSGLIKVYPGAPQLKLWPDSIISLGEQPDGFSKLLASHEKRVYQDTTHFKGDPPILKRIYILAGQSQEIGKIEPLSPAEALEALFSYSFMGELVKEGKEKLFKDQRAQIDYFVKYTSVAKQVSVRRLWRRFDLAILPQLVDLIAQDVE